MKRFAAFLMMFTLALPLVGCKKKTKTGDKTKTTPTKTEPTKSKSPEPKSKSPEPKTKKTME